MEENKYFASNSEQPKDKPVPVWIKSGAAFAGGAAAGVTGALLVGGIPAAAAEVPAEDGENTDEVVDPVDDNASAWTDGQVNVAHGVNDGMSFGQAFAAARAEVGPGGVFEWRGGVYGTYYEQEWNAMTPAQRSEWSSHFNWSNVTREPEQHTPGTNHDTGTNHDPGTDPHHNPPVQPVEHTYEVISVHEAEDGTMMAYVKMDGHDCVMFDTDGYGVFDSMAVDLNDDGSLQENELMPIDPAEGLTVNWAIGQMEPVVPDIEDPQQDIIIDIDPGEPDEPIDINDIVDVEDPDDIFGPDTDPDYIEPTNFDDI